MTSRPAACRAGSGCGAGRCRLGLRGIQPVGGGVGISLAKPTGIRDQGWLSPPGFQHQHLVPGSALSRLASTEPAEPAPTTMKSAVRMFIPVPRFLAAWDGRILRAAGAHLPLVLAKAGTQFCVKRDARLRGHERKPRRYAACFCRFGEALEALALARHLDEQLVWFEALAAFCASFSHSATNFFVPIMSM